jgi:hypothetical protein
VPDRFGEPGDLDAGDLLAALFAEPLAVSCWRSR